MEITMPVELYTDGSSLRNPGPSGLGYIIRYWVPGEDPDVPVVKEIEGNQGFRLSTNNRMEIMGGIYGLNKIIEKIKDGTIKTNQINLQSDSKYFCNAVNQGWITKWQNNNWMTSAFKGKQPGPVKNKDLWEKVLDIQRELQSMSILLTLTYIEGHAGHEFNERTDRLAVAASTSNDNQLIDEEYERTVSSYNKN